MSWRLRKSKKTIYGPVELPELRHWAADGRILAADDVSENEGDWKPASELADLELNWLIPRPDGPPHGPLHIRVCAELLHRQILRGNETLVHRTTGEQISAALAIAAELLRSSQIAPPSAKPQAPPPTPAPAPITPAPRGDASTLEQALRDAEFRNERLRARNVAQVEEITSLCRTIEELQNSTSDTTEAFAKLAAARDRAEAHNEELTARIAELKEQYDAALRDLRDLNARYIQLRDATPSASKPKVRLA